MTLGVIGTAMAVAAMHAFVDAWVHPGSRLVPIAREELDRVEARFETYLPLSYRDCMEQVGPPSASRSLLSTIVKRRLDIPDISEFLSPNEVISTTEGWRDAGLPDNMVAFAATNGGDLYCFEVVPETAVVPLDAMVWYFDHEERSTESLDILFDPWLRLYAQIPDPPSLSDDA